MLMPSGAAHDTMCVADHVPSAMVFVPCKDGISHSPLEDADRRPTPRSRPRSSWRRSGRCQSKRRARDALGIAASATSHRTATTTKPVRPSPGSENDSPSSGVADEDRRTPTVLTNPTAAAGASGRLTAAPVNDGREGDPSGDPDQRGPERLRAPAAAPPRAARCPRRPRPGSAPTARRTSPGRACRIQPPSGRVTTPSTSVSAPITPAAPWPRPPWRSSSVTTQLPTDDAETERGGEDRRERDRGRRSRTIDVRAPRVVLERPRGADRAGRRRGRATPRARPRRAVAYGARQPIQLSTCGTTASARPPPARPNPPKRPCAAGEPPLART